MKLERELQSSMNLKNPTPLPQLNDPPELNPSRLLAVEAAAEAAEAVVVVVVVAEAAAAVADTAALVLELLVTSPEHIATHMQ